MARGQKLRPSYADDASYLVRLANAVEGDTRIRASDRARLSAVLQEAAGQFSILALRIAQGNNSEG